VDLEGDQHTDDARRMTDVQRGSDWCTTVQEERGVERMQLDSLGDGGLDVLEREREVGRDEGGSGLTL